MNVLFKNLQRKNLSKFFLHNAKINPINKQMNLIKVSKFNFCDKKDDDKEKNSENKNSDKNNKNSDKNMKDHVRDFREYLDYCNPFEIIIEGAALLFIIYYVYNYRKSKPKQINLEEFQGLVQNKNIVDLEMQDNNDNSVNIKANLKDNSSAVINITNKDFFLSGLEHHQRSMGTQIKDFIPIKLSKDKEEELREKKLLLAVVLVAFMKLKVNNFKTLKSTGKHFTNHNSKNYEAKKNFNKSSNADTKDNQDKTKEETLKDKLMSKLMGDTKEFKSYEISDVDFSKVAGMTNAKQEISEFVEFLKTPEKFNKLGAKIPRGALLEGPPGTGKTLLAKALAGETKVPFYAVSGSEFVETYVGLGASRIRKLFKQAIANSPSIIFIDEIDSIGRARGGSGNSSSEQEQTLNQLLVELDGFGTNNNVVVLAATNRKDMLDQALMRPGRFDRLVEIELPNRQEREEILKIYLNKVTLDKSKTVDEFAKKIGSLSPGMSGADLANVVNEAAIISARNEKESVDEEAINDAIERVTAGLKTTKLLTEKEKKHIAYSEAAKVVTSWFLENANPVITVTIIPRNKKRFSRKIDTDISLERKEDLEDSICTLLSGKISEEIFLGSTTDHTTSDLRRAWDIAMQMVASYGMSRTGLKSYAGRSGLNISREHMKGFDDEVKHIIDDCNKRTKEMVNKYKDYIQK